MKIGARNLSWFTLFLCIVMLSFGSPFAYAGEEAPSLPMIKVAILEKMAKGHSAQRFGYLYPALTQSIRQAFLKDGRFELLPQEEINRAMAGLKITRHGVDPDDAAQLREIGREAGADFIFVSYYYEMSCHGGSISSYNVLSLVSVGSERVKTISKSYNRDLSDKELASSDEMALRELLSSMEPFQKGS